jgi:flagellin-like protein
MKIFRKDDEAVSPVIAVILMVAITVVLAGVLWAMLSQLGTEESAALNITAKNPVEKTYGWQIEISSISGSLNLEDAKFQVVDNENTLLYSLTIDDANPAAFAKGASTVYAMTKGAGVVDDTNATVDGNDALSVYSGCYIAYIDQTGDGKCNGGDTVYVYADYDGNSVDDVASNYAVKILSGDDMAMNKKL